MATAFHKKNILKAGSAFIYSWFYTQVRNRGPWDYKKTSSEYEAFGNFNYGATGTAAGFSEGVLLRAAGFAQNRAGTSTEEFGTWWGQAPFGDDPADQRWIKEGIRYAKFRNY
ncbi:polymorphic toxin type 44 domain-containing protein [Pseudomonas agarici]|uniref:polymorphic toxin type 44 domain-containing protein n=1 Tax=Pseudomonas agarici TaxID=46677 RepID=UPI0009D996C2|nr:polymorphic toxin type 44 domain-containing protein [Pseudomonas agarici]NWB93542.1 bacteriocin [Pseudomonas agarici]NWC11200.1 bacteriocin [Pseudomonas agarici]